LRRPKLYKRVVEPHKKKKRKTCEAIIYICCRNVDHDKKIMKEGRVSSKGKSFAEYMVQYAREGSARKDTIEN